MNLLGYGILFRYGFRMFWMWFLYGFDKVWERSAFFRVPDGLASRKETETVPGQPFGRCLDCFCGFEMILIQFWYDFDMVLIQFGYGSDGLASNHGFDPHQESKLKPYQDHIWNRINIIAAEQLITTNHIWNVWKTLNKQTTFEKPSS